MSRGHIDMGHIFTEIELSNTREQQVARERVRERMRLGYHLGGKRLQREEIYNRRTDYN